MYAIKALAESLILNVINSLGKRLIIKKAPDGALNKYQYPYAIYTSTTSVLLK